MLLYLVQHAQSRSEAEDPARSLSPEGQATAARMAQLLGNLRPSVSAIWHSDKLRARQTAEALVGSVEAAAGLQQVGGLAPLEDVAPLAARLRQQAEDLMLVGHLPHLSRLASTLLVSDPEKKLLEFQMGGIVCLRREETGQWCVQWMLTPELVTEQH